MNTVYNKMVFLETPDMLFETEYKFVFATKGLTVISIKWDNECEVLSTIANAWIGLNRLEAINNSFMWKPLKD